MFFTSFLFHTSKATLTLKLSPTVNVKTKLTETRALTRFKTDEVVLISLESFVSELTATL